MKHSQLRQLVKEVLDEMSTTGGVAGYLTPYAFSKNTNRATKFLQKLGYKKVERPKRPSHTKMFDYLDEMHVNTPHAFVSEKQMEDSAAVKHTEKIGYSKVKKSQKTDNKAKK